MTTSDFFKAQIPQESIQPPPPPEVTPVIDPGTTAATRINTISNSILGTAAEVAPGIFAIAGIIYLFRKVYKHTLGDLI